MALSLKALKRQRAGTRTIVTRTCKSVETSDRSNFEEITFLSSKLNELKITLIDFDRGIHSLLLRDDYEIQDEYEKDCESCEKYVDHINRMLSRLGIAINSMGSNSNADAFNNSGHGSSKLKLPDVDLPKFDGKPEEFARFRDSFEAIMSKFNLTQLEKFSYLIKQLSGPAKDIVDSVPRDNVCYDSAIKLLTDCFSSVVTQQFSVIERLLNLKLVSDADFHHWIGEVRILVDQIKRLEINEDIFTQYFIWCSLSKNINSHLFLLLIRLSLLFKKFLNTVSE